MKELTSSVYSFEKLINGGYLYVDKTEFIWRLVENAGESYFLSRPRRFGKSLTVSTLKAVFEGKKELFRGLAIYDKPYDWKPYPVIHLDLNGFNFDGVDAVKSSLGRLMRETAAAHSLPLEESEPEKMFREIIDRLSKTAQVVILLDEYDKPILNNIGTPEVKQVLTFLKSFYSVIKAFEGKLRCAFITGVSKFSHVSLFSDLNNLTDLTMDARFATMFGYTQEELEANFADRIAALAAGMDTSRLMADIKAWYDGYRFEENAPTVYNPVSLAKFFDNGGKFNNYWFATATPSFLLEQVMKSKLNLEVALDKPVSSAFFDAFEVTDLDAMVLLYQTGYLTIDRAERRQMPFTSKTVTEYYLHFPNYEVEHSFNDSLLAYCTNVRRQDAQELIFRLINAVGTGDAETFLKILQSVFAGIPYSIHVRDEHYYQTVIFVICDLLKLMVQAEVQTSSGRIDMMVAAGEWIYVIEFKLNKSAEKALTQIENKDYALKYHKDGKRVMLLGVNFDFNAGNITSWLKEEYRN